MTISSISAICNDVAYQIQRGSTLKTKPVVYDLKFVGPLEFELVAPMPEQLKTTTMHFYEDPRKPY